MSKVSRLIWIWKIEKAKQHKVIAQEFLRIMRERSRIGIVYVKDVQQELAKRYGVTVRTVRSCISEHSPHESGKVWKSAEKVL